MAPKDGYYQVELWGAQGGSITGFGAYVSGEIYLQNTSYYYLYVGGKGDNATNDSQINKGGYNGGGTGAVGTYTGGGGGSGGGGGGATDFRLLNGDALNEKSLKSRIMVAAGGGGSGGIQSGQSIQSAASAGGLIGYFILYGGYFAGYNGNGGTQISSGTGGLGDNFNIELKGNDGGFGYGGNGTDTTHSAGGGGGGSGYYGGGASGSAINGTAGSGGGGSSFISGHKGCDAIKEESTESNIIHTGEPYHYSGYIFTDTKMIDGMGYAWTDTKQGLEAMPNPSGGYYDLGVGHTGNGFVRITYLGR